MEWFNELIGFLIILFVFLFPLVRKFILARQKKRSPQEVEEEPIEEYEVEYEKEKPAYTYKEKELPPSRYTTKRLVKKNLEFHSEIEARELESEIEERLLKTKVAPKFKERVVSQAFILAPTEERKRKERTIGSITQRYTPLQKMVIVSEILGRPKGLPEGFSE